MLASAGAERADLEPVLSERTSRVVVVMNFQIERGRMRAGVAQIARHEYFIALVLEAAVDHLYRLHVQQQDKYDGDESHRSQHDEKRTLAHGRRRPPTQRSV